MAAVTPMSRRAFVLGTGGAVLASVLTGCAVHRGSTGFAAPPGGGPSGIDPAAFDAWRDFPVTRRPRPIVLLDPPLRESGRGAGVRADAGER
jgi:hypothetical protein